VHLPGTFTAPLTPVDQTKILVLEWVDDLIISHKALRPTIPLNREISNQV